VRQHFLALDRCARLRDNEARSPLEAAGAGVGPSRSRHRPPSTWLIESSPVPPDERTVAGAAGAGVEQDTIEGEVASCWRPALSEERKPSRRDGERSGGAGSLSWTLSKTGIRESPFITREEIPPRLSDG
jgi:hypothetical protein